MYQVTQSKNDNLICRYQNSWPAIKQDLNGVIVLIDSKNNKYDNVLDE